MAQDVRTQPLASGKNGEKTLGGVDNALEWLWHRIVYGTIRRSRTAAAMPAN